MSIVKYLFFVDNEINYFLQCNQALNQCCQETNL